MALDGAGEIDPLPKQGKDHDRAEGRAETGPGKGNNAENGTVGVLRKELNNNVPMRTKQDRFIS